MQQEKNPRAAGLQREIEAMEGRDLQLWSIGLLVILVVAAGFIALVLPNVMWNLKTLRFEGRYLPQLFFGFIVLILLFNIYVIDQRRVLRRAREELVRELVRSEAAEKLSLVDPLTEIYNRRYLDQLLTRETSRADRLGSNLTFLMIDVDAFKSVNTRFGHRVGDQMLADVAVLLKRTFRTSDTIVRYGGDEFLLVLTDTDEAQAQRAVERLFRQVETWNQTNAGRGYTLSVSCGLASYRKGANVVEVIEAADQKMYLHKTRHLPAG